jgi:hypothetical protein
MEEASITIRNPELAFEICDFRKNKHEHYYLCEYNSGTLRLGGEESERNCPENFYQLQWIPLQEVAKINLLPMAAKEWILETLINPSNIPVHTPPPARDFRPD